MNFRRLVIPAAVLALTSASVSCGSRDRRLMSGREIMEAAGRTYIEAEPCIRTVMTEERDGYTCSLIEYSSENGDRIKAYLLEPSSSDSLRHPAVLMLHDHGARFDIGKEKLARPAADAPYYIKASAEQWSEKYFDGEFLADRFAANGYVVLVSDALYWGERASAKASEWSALSYSGKAPDKTAKKRIQELKEDIFNGQVAVHDSLLVTQGIEFAGKILYDDIAAAKLLAGMPSVDSGRIGVFGFSMGAHRAWLLAAVSENIACGAAVCWMTTLGSYDGSSPSDLSMRLPALREKYDFPDIAGCLYPKPMLFLNGSDDPLFPKEHSDSAFAVMQGIYGRLSETDGTVPMLETKFFEGGHHCGNDVIPELERFFSEHLSKDKDQATYR